MCLYNTGESCYCAQEQIQVNYKEKSPTCEYVKETGHILLLLSLSTRKVPMFGLEAVFRNGVPVGHLRRSDYGFFIDKTIGYGYIRNPDGGVVNA